jgi:hypothetical protein
LIHCFNGQSREGDKGTKRIKGRRKGVKVEDKKKMIPA